MTWWRTHQATLWLLGATLAGELALTVARAL